MYDENNNVNNVLYFEKGNAKKIMHPETAEKLREILVILDEKGEDEAFKNVKKLVKNKNY